MTFPLILAVLYVGFMILVGCVIIGRELHAVANAIRTFSPNVTIPKPLIVEVRSADSVSEGQ